MIGTVIAIMEYKGTFRMKATQQGLRHRETEETQLPNDHGAYLQICLCVKNKACMLDTVILDIL